MPFAPTVALQERVREGVLSGEQPEQLLLCEHDPVITLGRGADPAHVLVPATELARAGIAIERTNRGGDVTYHGPGQLVAYPIVRLRRGVVAHVEAMAQAVIAVLASLGIEGRWSRERPGVWVDGSKVCAFGVHVRRSVCIHGLALNVTLDPIAAGPGRAFAAIVPCGLADANVTTVAACVPSSMRAPDVAALTRPMAMALADALCLSLACSQSDDGR